MVFSVIIPVYNVEKYLRECVDSILAQTVTDYELILVDDGATDTSGAICDEYAQKHERVQVIHQANAGQAVARNTGTEIAQGEYILYLDSDDYICDCDFLEKLAQKTKNGSDVILYGYKKYFESNQSFGKDICQYPILAQKENAEVISALLKADKYDGSPWDKTVRRAFLQEHGIRFAPGMISEDSDWFLQVVTRAKTYDSVNEAFVVYRQREGSTSHALKIKSLTDNILILETWKKRFEEMQLSESFIKVLMSVLARYYANLLVLYTRFDKKETEPYYGQVKALGYLLQFSVTSRAKTVKFFHAVFGLRITLFLLGILNKIKRTT